MSYILDALKRADSERERGAVPGLHAQPAAALPATPASPQKNLVPWAIGAAAVLLAGGAGVAAWRSMAKQEAAPAAQALATAPAAPALAAPTPPSPAPAPLQAPPTPAPAKPPAAVPAPPPPPIPAPPAPPAPPVPIPAPAPPRQTAAAPPAPAPLAPAAAPAERTYTLQELPEDIRRQLPALAISGAVHSADPAQRMLIVNGQVVQEGGQPAPEVALLQIGPKSAVLGFRGYRFSVAY